MKSLVMKVAVRTEVKEKRKVREGGESHTASRCMELGGPVEMLPTQFGYVGSRIASITYVKHFRTVRSSNRSNTSSCKCSQSKF
jgi:hypothetical protein